MTESTDSKQPEKKTKAHRKPSRDSVKRKQLTMVQHGAVVNNQIDEQGKEGGLGERTAVFPVSADVVSRASATAKSRFISDLSRVPTHSVKSQPLPNGKLTKVCFVQREVIDRTSQTQNITHNRRGFLIHSRSGTTRSLPSVNSMVLHQTGFNRGDAIDAYDTVIAHFVVLQNGNILMLRTLDTFLNNAYSRASVSVEFVGNFLDIRGRGTGMPTSAQISAGRSLVMRLHDKFGLSGIFSHQQFNPTGRPNCPGPHIWFNVGRWAVNHLGLSSTPPGGRPVLSSWEDSRFEI